MNVQSAKERLGNKFANVVELSPGVLRSVRREGGSSVAAYVFDFNDKLSETAARLTSYLDDVLGRSYFDEGSPPDLRWNHYLYFVVRKESSNGDDFKTAKRTVEADKSYARKYVIYEDDFDRALNDLDTVATAGAEVSTGDVMQVWATKLEAAGLDSVLDTERAVADVVRVVATTTPKKTVRKLKTSGEASGRLLAASALLSVDLTAFRPYPSRRQFGRLGKANLIVGANGVGKTSLLEGIEYLYCGANRRSTVEEEGEVTATLSGAGTVRTTSAQAVSDFKTRQRLWYGTNDTSRRNTLPNQFARFNFLNTDAAAELALRRDEEGAGPQGNADSLADLLSGHEATLLWRRIEAVHRAVEDERRAKESERSVAAAERRSREAELKSLAAAPTQSDAAFEVLAKDLARVGWRMAISGKEHVSPGLVDDLSETASRLGVAKQVDWAEQSVNGTWLKGQMESITDALEALRQLHRTLQGEERKRQSIQRRLAEETNRRNALASIDPESVTSLLEHVGALERVASERSSMARVSATLATDRTVEVDAEWLDRPLGVAASTVVEKLATSRSESSALQGQLRDLTANQSRLQEVLLQLRVLAKRSIEHLHSDEACPVCGTQFKAGELVERIDSMTSGQSESQALDTKRRLDESLAKQKLLEATAARLDQLVRFADAARVNSGAVTVAESMRQLAAFLERQRALSALEQAHRQAVEAFGRAGLTVARLWQLCAPDTPPAQDLNDLPTISSALAHADELTTVLKRELLGVDSVVSELLSAAEQQLTKVGLDSGLPLASAVEQLQSRRSLLLQMGDAYAEASRVAAVAPSTDIRMWLSSLEAAVLSAKTVLALVQAEVANADRKRALENQVAQLNSKLARLGEVVERLARASGALSDIAKNHSLEQATKAAVEATHRVADIIFGRIHAPSEYRVTTDTKAPLARRDGDTPVALNQVSTGQRAAYALSMFLAMNAQVRSGPQVILLDDPISHIDDLNALSFLDYLRNLVLQSNRQVFFATADEKVAGLFAHKFGFLGDAFRTFELSRA